MRVAFLMTVLLSMASVGLCARILAIFPFYGKSHHIFISSIMKALVHRGHHVVEYSPFAPSKQVSNYTHVPIHSSFVEKFKQHDYEEFIHFSKCDQPKFGVGFSNVWQMMYNVCEETLKHKIIQKLLKSNEHFDIVLTESTFGQESMVLFGHKFRAPIVTLQGSYSWCGMNRDSGNSLSIASVPQLSSRFATNEMSLLDRLSNMLSTLITLFSYYNYHLPIHEKMIRQNYKQTVPPLADMLSNISLYLVNTHPAIEYPRPYTPNIVPIGGITISSERLPLPQNIQQFMDEAKEGVIYFSLGTVVPAHLFPKEVLQVFLNTFKRLKQKVLWKIDIQSLPDLSENVMLVKWVSQPGVLAHPNCVLFLTHGGLFGQQESIHAGVPTVMIPFFGDQHFNTKLSEYHGIGVKLDFYTLSEETAYSALSTVLNNTKYKENAMRMSRIHKDRPMSPADTVIFWVEYVLRHDGAYHLRPAATQLSWYQLALLDVLAAILIAVIIVFIIFYQLLKKILFYFLSKTKDVFSIKKCN